MLTVKTLEVGSVSLKVAVSSVRASVRSRLNVYYLICLDIFGSRPSLKPSPNKFTDKTVIPKKRPGKNIIHGAL